MKKQKICIIGGGLTGLITALTLSKLNLKIDLITDSASKNVKSSRTTAISQNNYDFLRKLNIFKLSKKEFWPSTKMKLYTETKNHKNHKYHEIFELNRDKKQKKIFYMMENSKIIRKLIKSIKKNKLILLKTKKPISKILSSGLLKSVKFNKNCYKYSLIIICTGSDSSLVKTLFKDKPIERSYKETSITTILNHSSFENSIARQIFLKKEILGLLPISNTRTSIVWTVKKNEIDKYKNKKNFHIKNKLKLHTKDFIKKVKFNSNIEYKNLNLLIRKRYYQDRILLFGDALHVVHPFAGQGFNMVLRDLISLEKLIRHRISLGLDIGSSDILSEFSNKIKPKNFIYSLSIDFIKNFFSFEEKTFHDFRNNILKKLNNNSLAKVLFFNLANKGFNF